MAKTNKAQPRGRRSYPQEARVVSTNFMSNMEALGKCFVPYEDFLKLEAKYFRLFKRYQREQKRS